MKRDKRRSPGQPARNPTPSSESDSESAKSVADDSTERQVGGFPQPYRNWLLGLLLLAATIFAYQPAWNAGFIWDDEAYVTHNELLTAPDGLKRIWFSKDSPSQYFPLTYTTFRIERALWGLNPSGYHWVNILLHGTNALLVWWLLKRLKVPGGWLAAAIFALHPVQVESVAWITERKNVLSLFFFLLALLAWVGFLDARSSRGRGFYFLALIFYALALFSKTVACTLPAALLLILWLKHSPITWRRVAQIVPFVVLGLAMGLVTIWWERHEQGTQGKHFMLSLPERLIVASHAVWFYASKLIWPANLAFSYPRWTIDPANPFAYLWLVAGAGVATAIYFARRYLGRSVEVAALFYVATLSPLLGFIMLYTFRYTFVADHYQYMAVIGPIALIAAGISIALRTSQKPFLKPIVYALILGTLFLLTGQQCGMYKDLETLWRTTLRRNPDSWMAHSNLGAILLDRGEIKEALPHFEKALELQPDDKVALNNLGQIHLQRGKVDEAIACYRKALADDPNYTTAHNNLAVALLQKGEASEALVHLQRVQKKLPNSADIHRLVGMALLQNGQLKEAMAEFQKSLDLQPATETHDQLGNALFQAGRTEEATAQFEKSLEMNPDDKVAHQNLGIILVQKGKVDEAIGHFKKAVASDPNYALGQATLGKVLSKTGKLQEAIPHLERAVEIQPRNPDAHFNLGAALWQAGEISRAIVQYQQAIDLQPNFPEAYSSLATAAWTLATSSNSSIRNPARSIELAEKADLFFNRKNPAVARILAAVYAEAGRFPEAIETGQRALDLSLGSDPLLTVRLQGEIQSYRTNAPLTRSLGISERKPTPVTNDR